ncbi:right-handed parallel beta-helix repeat-containing protein [Streptomyces sp. BE20]|uniref:right-handed parallel beta-helix repeat-containing protein n=1 Tax=Streptomyces sp. BE20 TaxID=3002525 RepID=UPI002E7A318B|nr:right-handed parallel beta-helix repeat-containing protein [Streptomyces sp. BE20]MEE1824239.1 right-handed parallel beta-helix repeat-containing protein [Streptomyces sp. BE20]
MPTRRVHHLAAATAAATTALTTVLTALGAAPAQAAGPLHLVRPGESIQQAVDAALPGDTVQLLPGEYRGSVRIATPGLTLRGAGPESVILPADTARAGVPETAAACATAGHGLCVVGADDRPLTGVTVEGLAVTGFRKNGINATGTDGMTVRATHVHDNGQQGISQERSTRGVITANESTRNGQSGVFLANTVDSEGGALSADGTVVSGNLLADNRIGVTVRRLRDLSVEQNEIHGNCGGVFVVGDEGVPRAGALTVTRNRVVANNRYCPPNPRLDHIQGAGIVLTGAEETTVTENQVRDNVGASPFSGGIVLVHSVVGVANARNTVADNLVVGNGPADLADRDTGTDNAFARNHCAVSEPAGHC